VLLPSATWCEKAGTFENWRGMLQAFEAATPVHEGARPEAQIALDLLRADGRADVPALFNAADTRRHAAGSLPELSPLVSDVRTPSVSVEQNADMEVVEL